MGMETEQYVGSTPRADGFSDGPTRVGRTNEQIVSDGQGRFYELTRIGSIFTLTLVATTTGVAAGNIVGAAAAAVTQFGLINPATSNVNLQLLQFGMGVISGTPGAGPLFHGFIPNIQSLTVSSPGGTARNNMLGAAGSGAAIPWALAAGSALAGSTQVPVTHKMADFAATATAQAIANGHVRAIENIEGGLVVPPGVMWLPLWSAAGTALLNSYSIVWAEVPK